MNQNYKVNKIIVINNCSTDGTEEYLELVARGSDVIITNLEKNIGGTGGFYEGIKITNDIYYL